MEEADDTASWILSLVENDGIDTGVLRSKVKKLFFNIIYLFIYR